MLCAAQLPYMQHGPNLVPETGRIMAYLRATYGKGRKDLMLGPVTDEQRAKIEAYVALIEASVPFGMGYYRLLHHQVSVIFCGFLPGSRLCHWTGRQLQQPVHHAAVPGRGRMQICSRMLLQSVCCKSSHPKERIAAAGKNAGSLEIPRAQLLRQSFLHMFLTRAMVCLLLSTKVLYACAQCLTAGRVETA